MTKLCEYQAEAEKALAEYNQINAQIAELTKQRDSIYLIYHRNLNRVKVAKGQCRKCQLVNSFKVIWDDTVRECTGCGAKQFNFQCWNNYQWSDTAPTYTHCGKVIRHLEDAYALHANYHMVLNDKYYEAPKQKEA